MNYAKPCLFIDNRVLSAENVKDYSSGEKSFFEWFPPQSISWEKMKISKMGTTTKPITIPAREIFPTVDGILWDKFS